jgi:hypothetical protein
LQDYRLKPSIVNILHNKLNRTLEPTNNTRRLSDLVNISIDRTSSSTYVNRLSSIVTNELVHRLKLYYEHCPYACNQPLPSDLVDALQPYLPAVPLRPIDRHIVRIAWFVSNCNTHSRREDYVAQLRSQLNIRIDIYGDCSSIYHTSSLSQTCRKGTDNCMKNILMNYRFYLSFENSQCDTYITEKYWIQGLNRHAVPIVLGARKQQYERIAVPNSYIHVDDYRTVSDLAQELHRLNRNDTAFVRYLQWIHIYDISNQFTRNSLDNINMGLCLLGHYQRLQKFTNDQIQPIRQTIRRLFNILNMPLTNFNWTNANSDRLRLSTFYNPHVNCWDQEYPSIFKQIYNHLFTWWKLFK